MKRAHHLLICLALVSAGCGLDPNAPQEPNQLATSLGTTMSGSGNPTDTGSSNAVEACQELEDTLAACQPFLDGSLQCSSYDGWPCDLTAYFDCVTDAYGMCSGGTFPDVDALSLQDCAMLTVCN